VDNQIEILFSLPASSENIRLLLAERVNDLIVSDFNQLISLLYRFDISENKLKQQLQNADANAGEIIADLIIQRDEEKRRSREMFKQSEDEISEEDKW